MSRGDLSFASAVLELELELELPSQVPVGTLGLAAVLMIPFGSCLVVMYVTAAA